MSPSYMAGICVTFIFSFKKIRQNKGREDYCYNDLFRAFDYLASDSSSDNQSQMKKIQLDWPPSWI